MFIKKKYICMAAWENQSDADMVENLGPDLKEFVFFYKYVLKQNLLNL